MSTKLQIVVSEEEARELRRRARSEGLTLSEWVRRALRAAASQPSGPMPATRLAALEHALTLGHPTGDPEQVMAEIERGRDLR